MQGTIKRIVQDRGFGFLRGDGEHTDMFFHVRNLASDLAFDEQLVERRIEFETAMDHRSGKMRAVNVRAAR